MREVTKNKRKKPNFFVNICLQTKNKGGLGFLHQLSRILSWCQESLFPSLEETVGPLSPRLERFAMVIELVPLEDHVVTRSYGVRGRPRADRRALARAFIAKAVLNLPDTRSLIDYLCESATVRRLCGWSRRGEIPSEATFSRAFAEFAATDLPQRLHETIIRRWESDRLVGHICRDATSIKAREKPLSRRAKPKRKQGKNRRIFKQCHEMTLDEMIDDLPKHCDVGRKHNSKGRMEQWAGYSLHIDWADGEIPISCLLTSASMHDSQAAIPLARISAQRVTNLYDIMDAAYDDSLIREHSISLNHVPIIDSNPRSKSKSKFDPAKARRYVLRATAERGFSRTKDSFGARFVRVRGHPKVFAHLMFGILALTVEQLLRAAS